MNVSNFTVSVGAGEQVFTLHPRTEFVGAAGEHGNVTAVLLRPTDYKYGEYDLTFYIACVSVYDWIPDDAKIFQVLTLNGGPHLVYYREEVTNNGAV